MPAAEAEDKQMWFVVRFAGGSGASPSHHRSSTAPDSSPLTNSRKQQQQQQQGGSQEEVDESSTPVPDGAASGEPALDRMGSGASATQACRTSFEFGTRSDSGVSTGQLGSFTFPPASSLVGGNCLRNRVVSLGCTILSVALSWLALAIPFVA